MRSLTKEGDYIVAIGASAGGLEAIHEFFDHMPGAGNLSFIIIQHLSPDYKSLLVDLVSRHTEMNVFEATDNLSIRRNCIYVIPNNKFITIRNNHLVLSEKLPLTFPNNAVDVFLESLAREKKSKAIAIILSGTGTDGTKGVRAIKAEGGMVIVQEPASSKFDGMPKSAIISGNADFVLPTNEIPAQVMAYVDENESENDDENSINDEMLDRIFGCIRQQAGFDFQYYKTLTITRRVIHRMRKANFSTVDKYCEFIQDNPDECRKLGKEILINVTRFFRDPEAFNVLRSEVLPAILDRKKPDETVKMWICACSTGEEAYSLSILLDEVLQETGRSNMVVKIFATDVEKSNIEIASKGYYPRSIEADISPERLKKYFVPQDNGYVIHSRIRKRIVFAVHNVIKDAPFIKNDLVTCRNMLIYMNSTLQQKIYSILLFSLSLEGYLFLGTTENPNPVKDHLEEVSQKWKVYIKKRDAKVSPILQDIPQRRNWDNGRSLISNEKEVRRPASLWDDFKETLFTDFNFAAFYIDRNFEIKEAVGNFDRILSLPKKILKLNLVRMLPGNVSATLIGEIKECWKSNARKIVRNLHFKNHQSDIALQVLIQPDMKDHPYTLIAFHFMQFENQEVQLPRPALPEKDHSDYVLSLEEELSETKGNLQYAVERPGDC